MGSRDGNIRLIALEVLSRTETDEGELRRVIRQAGNDGNALVRQFALEVLVASTQWTDERAEVLEAALRDPNTRVREIADHATVADRFGPRAARDELLAATESPSALDREAALFQLVARDPDDPSAWEAASRATTDPDVYVRSTAFDLAFMWRATTDPGRRIIEAATRDTGNYARYSAMVAVTLASLERAEELALPGRALIDLDATIRQFGVETMLLRRPDSEQTLSWLIRACSDSLFTIRMFAQRTLAERWGDDPRSFAALRSAARAESRQARVSAVTMLATRWPDDPATLAAVYEAAEDSDQSVRLQAIDHLVVRWPGHAGTAERVDRATWDDGEDVSRYAWQALTRSGRVHPPATAAESSRLTRDSCPAARTAGLEALLIRWPDAPQTRDAVRFASADPSWPVQRLVQDAICLRWPDDEENALVTVACALTGPEVYGRSAAIEILAQIGTRRPATRGQLLTRLHDTTDYVRSAAAEVLFAAWPDDPEIQAAARHLARDLDGEVRLLALRYLVAYRTRDELAHQYARTATLLAATDPGTEIRRFALEALAAFWPDDPETRAAYEAARNDPSHSVRALTWTSFQSRQRRHGDFDAVASAASSSECTERWDALDWLSVRWPDSAHVHDLLRRATADPVYMIRGNALYALARIRPDDPTTHQLLRAGTRDPRPVVRETAVSLLAEAVPDVATTPDIVRARLGDADYMVRATACTVYARRWPDRVGSEPGVLTGLLRDPHWWVRRQAVRVATSGRLAPSAELFGVSCDSALGIRAALEIPLARLTRDLPSDLPTLLARYSGGDRALAAKAAYALAMWWGDRDEVLPVLRAEAAGQDHDTRIRSLMALVARFGACAETRDLLARAAASDCPGVRQAALDMLTEPAFGGITGLAKKAILDDQVLVRTAAREWLALHDVSSPLLADLLVAAVPSADPAAEQFVALKELVLRGREDPGFRESVERIARNIELPDPDRDWWDWFCARIAA